MELGLMNSDPGGSLILLAGVDGAAGAVFLRTVGRVFSGRAVPPTTIFAYAGDVAPPPSLLVPCVILYKFT